MDYLISAPDVIPITGFRLALIGAHCCHMGTGIKHPVPPG